MKLGEIIGAGFWTASAISVAGFTFKSFAATKDGYPTDAQASSNTGNGVGGVIGNLVGRIVPKGAPSDPAKRYKDAVLAAMSGGNPASVRQAMRQFGEWAARNPDAGYTPASINAWKRSVTR